ncbi:MAG: Calx-beta domain-containing protein [Chthoniobacterales bacterium]
MGRQGTTTYTTLANWQGATGRDANSKAVDPLFVSAADLHLTQASTLNGMATPIAGITTDFDGETRSATAPDIGADEIAVAGSVQFASPTYSVNEGAGTVTVMVTRTGGGDGAVSVGYATADGTATSGAGNDYIAQTGTVTFAAGDTAPKNIMISIIDDSVFEGNEDFSVNLSNPMGGATLGTPASTTVTIVDNDTAPTVQFSSATYSVNENAGPATLTVTLSGASALPASVNYSTADGTATSPADYNAASGTVTFAPGETSKTVNVTINDDTTFEGNENFSVSLSNPSGATLGSPSTATVTIIDDDAAPLVQFSAANYDVNEGAGTVTVTVTKTGNTTLPATVSYATSDGTATAPADYTTTAGTLTFAPGDTSKTFTIPIVQDTIYEGNEMFNVTLSAPVGATLGAPNPATVTILDDDTAPTFTIDSVSQNEGNSGTTPFVFTVTKTGSTSLPATVQFATADGTATTADNDYVAQSGMLTFAPGDTTMTITVNVNGDTTFEPDETFTVNLASPTNATITTATGTGTIVNDDAAPTFTIDNVSHPEGNSGQTAFVFTVTKSGASNQTSTVDYATQDGTATTADSDYVAASGTLTFAANETTKTVTVQVNGDTKFEPDETFMVALSNVMNNRHEHVNVVLPMGVGTIVNDDGQPTFTISNVSQNEGNSGTTPFVFTVTKNGLSGQSSTVDYATVDGTATVADNDYTATNGTLTFGPSDTTMTITVQVTGDTKVEPDENFTVQLSNIMNNRHERIDGSVPIVGTGTILNDDVAPTAITVTPAGTPTATDNDYTRINNAVQTIASNGTITLNGNFNWTEPNAAASWAAGSDGTPGTLDDYSILVPDGLSGVTFTASSLGAASIQGPGDIPTFDLEGVFFFDGGTNTNWTISNIRFLDFDLTIGVFYEPAGTNNFSGTHIVNNYIRMAVDTAGDPSQNLGILYSFGVNQLISGNTIDIPGDGIGGSEVAIQSNSGGGTSYDGLQITNNTLRILNAQSATPEFILGIWENGNSSSSNITVSGNTFANMAAGNDPTLNSQLAFEVTSHSSASSVVLYANNTVAGANQAFKWYPGINYGSYLPVQLTDNTLTGNAHGVLVQSQGQAILTANSITGIGGNSIGVRAIDGLTTVDIVRTTISGTGTAVSVDATDSNSNPVTMRITNSTLSGNTAASGGALNATGTNGQSNTTITNSTLTGNSSAGPSIVLQDCSLTVGNSIFNTKPPGANISASGTSLVTSLGYNLSSDNFQGFLTSTGDQTNKDAILGPLKNNGGPTFTHAPLTGSPAIDQGKDFGPVGPGYAATGVDQRGFARPQTYNDPSITPPAGGDRSDIGAVELAPGVTPLSAVSRKVHGAAGTFDIPLSLSGPVEIECRSGGASGVYQLVVTFATPVTFNSAVVTSGTGMVTGVSSAQIEGLPAATTVTIDLAGVTNLQRLTVALLGVNDGSNSGDVGVRVGIVLGDTTGNGAVGSSDVSQAKAQSGQPVTTANFRNDVNVNGAITSSDIGLIKSQSGAVLPPVPAEPTREEQ